MEFKYYYKTFLLLCRPSLWMAIPVEFFTGMGFALAWSSSLIYCNRVAPVKDRLLITVINNFEPFYKASIYRLAISPFTSFTVNFHVKQIKHNFYYLIPYATLENNKNCDNTITFNPISLLNAYLRMLIYVN